MIDFIYPIFFALTLTLLSETIVYYFLKPKDLSFIVTVLVMNAVLNSVMNVVFILLLPPPNFYPYLATLLIVEAGIVLLETLIIYLRHKTPLLKTFIFAFLANGVSLGLGLLHNVLTAEHVKNNASLVIGFMFIIGLCIFLCCAFLVFPANKVDR